VTGMGARTKWRTTLLAFAALLTVPLAPARANESPDTLTVVVRTFPEAGDASTREMNVTGGSANDGHLSTGPNSSLEILFPDGARLCLAPQSNLSLDSSASGGPGAVHVVLSEGFFHLLPGVPPHPSYAISTPYGEVDPGGSDLYCSVSANASGIACLVRRGTATVRNKDSAPSLIRDGDFWSTTEGLQRTAAAGASIPVFAPITRSDFDQRMQQLDVLSDCGSGPGPRPGSITTPQTIVVPDPAFNVSPTRP
jgi:hypothetical protein